MNPYVGFISVAGPITVLLIAGVYMKFRGGLATRIFAVVVPTIVAAGFAGLMAGLNGGSMDDHGMAGLIMGPASFIALFSLYRMVVVNFETMTSDIMASAAQIAATNPRRRPPSRRRPSPRSAAPWRRSTRRVPSPRPRPRRWRA